MENYDKDDVLKALNSIQKNSRKRELVDQRSYLIGVLYQKFNMTEQSISDAIGMKRCTVNYAKRLPVQFKDDLLYRQNIYVYEQMFPFNFEKYYVTKAKRNSTVILSIDDKLNRKLIKIKKLLDHDDIRTTIKHLLDKSLKLWEK